MLVEGTQLGPYSILRLIGSSNITDTYLAENKHSHQQVVVKIFKKIALTADEASHEEKSRRFMNQARELSNLYHPGILLLIDYGEARIEKTTYPYLVTRFYPDGSLMSWVEQHQLSLREVASVVSKVANALQYAHEHGVIHKNVKPSNLLLDQHGEHLESLDTTDLLLSDFMASIFGYETINITEISDKHTLEYHAPEQSAGNVTDKTDQYALAVIAYQLISGYLPFENREEHNKGETEQEIDRPSKEEALPTRSTTSRIPAEINSVLRRALAQKPEDRYPSILAFAQAFKQVVEKMHATTTVVEDKKEQVLSQLPTAVNTVEKLQEEVVSPAKTTPVLEEEHVHGNDIYIQVPISRSEARRGTTCKVTLPEGRSVTIPIPPRTRNGQVIRLENQGELPVSGGVQGALIITVIISGVLSGNSLIRMGNGLSHPRTTALTAFAILIILNAIVLLIIGNVNRANAFNQVYTDVTATARIHNAIAASVAASATAQGQATATFVSAHYPFSNVVGLDDSLTDGSKDYGWPATNNCQFSDGAYHITAPDQNTYDFCEASNKAFSDFTFQVQMVISKGDCGGIIFRDNSTGQHEYLFLVCQDGSYVLKLEQSYSAIKAFANHFSPAINKGVGQPNLIAVVAQGNTINLYANNQLLYSVQDNTYNSTYGLGQVGLVAYPNMHPTEVFYSDAKVWIL